MEDFRRCGGCHDGGAGVKSGGGETEKGFWYWGV